MLAAYMMAQDDLSATEAVNRVRGARPGSVETRHQETALDIFEKHLGDKKREKKRRSRIVKDWFVTLCNGNILLIVDVKVSSVNH